MDFLMDLKRLVQRELSTMGYTGKPEDDLDKLLLRYHNVRARIPRQVSWEVKVSQEISNKLSKKILKSSEDQGLKQFIQDAKAGKDLKPYLSDTIKHPDSRDPMLYDWDIHHFHLSTTQDPKRPGLVKRSAQVLFAVSDSSDDMIYLVDVQRHTRQDQAFENANLIRIFENNWPDVLKRFTLEGIGTTKSGLPSGQEVREDRKAGLANIVTTPGGRTLSPMGGGITTAGTSVRIRMAADRDQRSARNLQEQFEQAGPQLEQYFWEQHGLAWEDLDIHLTSFSPSIVVTERNTETVLYPEQRTQ